MSDLPPNDPIPPTTPGPVPTPGTPGPTLDPGVDRADFEKNKMMAVLAYIIWLIPLLAAKDSPYARFHTNQGILLTIAAVGCMVALVIVWLICMFIPYVGWCASCVLYIAFLVGVITLVIMGIMNALNGKLKPLPVIGGFTILK